MNNISKYSKVISKTLEKKPLPCLNNVSMKYRYEKMMLSEIAFKLRPNLRREQGNLFERLLNNKSCNIDKDILISQKFMKKNPKDNTFDLMLLYENKTNAKSNNEKSERKSNEGKVCNKEQLFQMNYFALNTNDDYTNELNDLYHCQKKENKKTLSPIYNRNQKLKQSHSTKHHNDVVSFYIPVINRDPLSYLNGNSLKMKYNLSKEQKVDANVKSINDHVLHSDRIISNRDSMIQNNDSLSNIFQLKSDTNKDNRKHLLRNLLSSSDSIYIPYFKANNKINSSNRDNSDVRLLNLKKQNSSTTCHNSFLIDQLCNYKSSHRLYPYRDSVKNKLMSPKKVSIIKNNKIKELDKIRQLNMKSVRNYFNEIEMQNSQKMHNEVKRIDNVHSKMFYLLNKFENDFSKKISNFSLSQSI